MYRRKSTQQIKQKARKTLSWKLSNEKKIYVVDTSAVINRFLPKLIRKGLRGTLIVPNAVIAELENLANKGLEEGFLGLEEVAKLHRQRNIKVHFQGARPGEMQIKFAKSGEIDALIRETARKNHAILITADLVQAKSSQAYGLQVIFLKLKKIKKKSRFFFWKR